MIFGEQYRETFAPVASIATVRIFLSWTTQHAMHARCIDISGAYCKAEMDEEYQIYMHPPKGCEEGTGPNGRPNVWILRKYLYGLKSSGWAWHRKLYTYLISIGFRACPQDPCLLQRTTEQGIITVITYVDDLPHSATTEELLVRGRPVLRAVFALLSD